MGTEDMLRIYAVGTVDLPRTSSGQIFRELFAKQNVNNRHMPLQRANQISARKTSVSVDNDNTMQPSGNGVLAGQSKACQLFYKLVSDGAIQKREGF